MNSFLQSFALLVVLLPMAASANYVQLAEDVYQDGTTLYIGSSVTSLGDLQVNPNEIYCYATIPPACVSNTFASYDATLHVPAAGMVSYFTTLYWYNFNNVIADAVEPTSLTLSHESVTIVTGDQFHISANVTPTNSTPHSVSWHSTNTAVATVSGGTVTTVAPGECDIVANCAALQAVCHVIATSARVTISLDKHVARVLPNHMLTLTATCSPTPTDLTVMSSDNSIVMPRLVNGVIQVLGIKEGTATITVGSVDGTANTDACQVTVYTELGDVNADGFVDVSDVTTLISRVLGNETPGFNELKADVNHDNQLDVSDVTMLISYILSGNWPWEIETFIVNGVSFKMVFVEGGTFTMGATAEQGSNAYDNEKPAHQVTLTGFYIGETEVTKELWQAVMNYNPSNVNSPNLPVGGITWERCQEFITKLNQITGKSFRLPTEAEWEYAARGGNKSQGYKFAGSNNIDEVGWYWDNWPSMDETNTHPVATKKSNELGLYDMSGNVNEWCNDWYGSYSSNSQTNPIGPISGDGHVFRGGSIGCIDELCRVSYRDYCPPSIAFSDVGLRLAL